MFTFSSLSTVALIQYYHKFSCISSLHSYLYIQFKHIQKFHKLLVLSNSAVISRSTDPTYSTLSQIQLYYLIPQSNLIQQFHILNSVTNSIVWSRFTFSSLSTVALIQYCYKFSCISSFTFISLSTVQTYSKVSQIHYSFLIPRSNLIQQSHILKSVTNSTVWSRFTFSSYSTVPYIHIVTNSIVLTRFTFSSLSTVALIQYSHKFSCISSLHSYLLQHPKHIQKFHKFTCLIQFHSLISFNSPTY